MKLRTIVKRSLASIFAGLVIAALVGVMPAKNVVNAIPYGSPAPNQPAFNIYTGAPAGIGDESDFVRLRKSNGDPTVPANTNNFIDPVSANCEAGEQFDIRTYIHNGASVSSNNDGSGPGVARDVAVQMNAPLGVSNDSFAFGSTISSSNATSVSDNGTLNCENEVELRLVPQTVNVYSQSYGWKSASDSSVNGSLKIGSREFASGDVWGCWPDTVVVVYVVEVVEKEVPPTPPQPPKPEKEQPEVVPTALPVTGVGSIAAMFTATSIGGAMAYRAFLVRRFRDDQ